MKNQFFVCLFTTAAAAAQGPAGFVGNATGFGVVVAVVGGPPLPRPAGKPVSVRHHAPFSINKLYRDDDTRVPPPSRRNSAESAVVEVLQ